MRFYFHVYVYIKYRIEYNNLAMITKPLNLGQGFPDYSPPSRFSNTLAEVVSEKNLFHHQYTRGLVRLQIIKLYYLPKKT